MELRIAHLYPDLMNTYGDMGNIIALTKRCEWRNVPVSVHAVSVGDDIDPEFYDLYFFGGGQDWQQTVVAEDLKTKHDALHEAKARGAVFLSICGGYQLLGHYYKPFEGENMYGVGIIDCYTQASHKRMIGNLVVHINSSVILNRSNSEGEGSHLVSVQTKAGDLSLITQDDSDLPIPSTLVGFENHSGQTFLGSNAKPLGMVELGFGNNGEDGTEGAVDGTAFGCYLHGSLLPKNPQFADYLLELALKRRHGEINLAQLDNTLELQAHDKAITRAKQASNQ